MIDCHNHILPGIDDGAHDLGMSLEMARVAVSNGIDTIICTPHHMNGVYTNSAVDILAAVDALRSVLDQENIPLNLIPGSELHLVPEIPDLVKSGAALTYANKGVAALVELPKRTVPAGAVQHLHALAQAGVTPIIAHPERNGELAAKPEKLLAWIEAGCCAQLTAQSVSGEFGHHIQRVCDYWIHNQCAHIIASDAHRPSGRKPDLSAAFMRVVQRFGKEITEVLFRENPERLILGEALIQPPAPKRSVAGMVTTARNKLGWM